MTTKLVLNDFVFAGATIQAGTKMDAALVTQQMLDAGLAVITYDAGTMAEPLAAFEAQKEVTQGVAPAYPNLMLLLIAAGVFDTSLPGNLAVSGTLSVGGAATLADDLSVAGNEAVTGNLAVTGTGAVAGDFSVNTSKFTVDATTGDAAVAGDLAVTADVTIGATLEVTSTTTLGDDLTIGASKMTVDAATGDTAIARDLAVTRNETVGGTLAVTGVTTPTGGIAAVGGTRQRIANFPEAAVAALGTDKTPVAGTLYYAEAFLPANKTVTGIALVNGSAAAGKVIVALYSKAGALLASSALAGTSPVGTNAYQEIPFTAPYAAVGPQDVLVVVQFQDNTSRFRAMAAAQGLLNVTGSQGSGSFGTLPAISAVGTSFNADVGPLAYLYT